MNCILTSQCTVWFLGQACQFIMLATAQLTTNIDWLNTNVNEVS